MKIIILSNLFPPNSCGGAEEAAKNQALKFLSQGDEVIILTLSPVDTKSVQIKDGLKIYELRHRNIFNYFNIGKYGAWARFFWHIVDTFNFRLANDIGKILKSERPDLAITHNLKGMSFLTPLEIKKLEIRNYQIVHDVSLYTPSGLIIYGKENIFEHTGFLTRGYRFFTRRLFKYAEKVFFPSAWLLNFYRKNNFYINQVKILEPNEAGFNPTVIPDVPSVVEGQYSGIQKNDLDSRLRHSTMSSWPNGGNDRNREGFLYVGQLEPHKGILFLLDVFSLLSSPTPAGQYSGIHDKDDWIPSPASTYASQGGQARNDRSVLHIVGDGSLMPEIKKRAELNPNIIVHGRVAHEKLPEFYARAKATIFPSLVYENAPMVIAESLSCGTPVICSCFGGAPELIRGPKTPLIGEGKNGVTFTPGDANDLAEKMKNFL